MTALLDWQPLRLLPAAIAIGVAILWRRASLALALGTASGMLLLGLTASTRKVWETLYDRLIAWDSIKVLLFTLLLGVLLALIERSGATRALALRLAHSSSNRKRTQLVTWGLGLVLFFDDYANSILVGTSMRPVADVTKVSREKLAFLVDATAAPVASLALVSSWIGVELSYIGAQYAELGIQVDPLTVFWQTIPHRFYPIFILAIGLGLILMDRDFGPMRRAEAKALARAPSVSSTEGEGTDKPRLSLAVVPLATLLITVLGTFCWQVFWPLGGAVDMGQLDSLTALALGAAVAVVTAVIQVRSIGRLAWNELAAGAAQGLRSMGSICMILVLAWCLSATLHELEAARAIAALFGTALAGELLPSVTFAISAALSFATGTSWGTMGIVFPLAVPLAHTIAPGNDNVLLGSVAAILSGAVWGDHCSPISDTTILSSAAAGCDHVEHVSTQLPYALLGGLIALLFGTLPVGYGLYPSWVGLLLGCGAACTVIRVVGQKVKAPTT